MRTAPARLDQRGAVQLALEGRPLTRARAALRAMRSLLADPEDTEQVFILNLLMNRAAFPQLLARFLASDDGLRLLKEQPAIDRAHVDYDRLRALPADTVGGAYARFLDGHGLTPDVFDASPGLPEVATYLQKRLRQSHDLWHVVTGYETDVPGELALLAFTFAQTRMPGLALIVLAGAARWAPSNPAVLRDVVEGFRRGRRAAFLAATPWEELWERPLAEVRAELAVPPRRAAA